MPRRGGITEWKPEPHDKARVSRARNPSERDSAWSGMALLRSSVAMLADPCRESRAEGWEGWATAVAFSPGLHSSPMAARTRLMLAVTETEAMAEAALAKESGDSGKDPTRPAAYRLNF